MAVGAAMRGLRPVVELMYDDFATECADPLFNQAAKDPLHDRRTVQRPHGPAGAHGRPAAGTQASIPSAWRISSATSRD